MLPTYIIIMIYHYVAIKTISKSFQKHDIHHHSPTTSPPSVMLFAKLYLGAMIMMAILVRCRSIRPTFVHQIRLHSRLFSSTIFNGAAITQRCDGYTHLDDIEDAATSCLSHHLQQTPSISQDELLNNHKTILNFPHSQRESIGVASNIKRTLDSFGRSGVHCRRCWLQRKHCVCGECVSLEGDVDVACDMGRMGIPNVKRLFLLVSVLLQKLRKIYLVVSNSLQMWCCC